MYLKQKIGIVGLIVGIVTLLALAIIWEDYYLYLSFGVIGAAILLLLVRFEARKVEASELVLLAVLAAIAAVSRVPFASIPSVQPTTFVIMMAGFVFGAESGFMIGAVAALASNMILGQGPWTPFQMVAWGLVGLTAGLLRNRKFMQATWGKALFGIVWGFIFGAIMNFWGLAAFIQSGTGIDTKLLITYFAGSALFDTMHAVSNVVFLLLFGGVWLKILTRFKRKYGLLE